ncbi:MAG: NAD-binding protein [Halanaeroarchaeum sp.]
MSARSAIVLTAAVGVLSIATGIANIGTAIVIGPATTVIPPGLRQAAGFTGAMTGFVLLLGAIGLLRGFRVAWYLTVLLLPVTALQGLVQSSQLSVPLVLLSLVSLPAVFHHRGRFTRLLDLSATQTASLTAILASLLYGTVGAYALREQFDGLVTVTDAIYYTIVTASTVGYGDVTPSTPLARWFGMTVVVVGAASFAAVLGALLGPAIERRLARTLGRMSDTRFTLFEDHVVVLGYGNLTEPILEELDDVPLVVVTPDTDRATNLRDRGYDVLAGDPSNDETLEEVGIEAARAVVAATDNDAEDAFAVMTARQLSPEARIVAAATDRDNVVKLRRAGATAVISPQVIGAHLLVQSALGSAGVEDVADEILEEESPGDAIGGD